MPTVNLTVALRAEYADLFESCAIRAGRAAEVNAIVEKLRAQQARYAAVQSTSGVPWYFVAVIHNMEASLNFKAHLHNGDPLTARTVQVPAGRPKAGSPPFTWEASAADALGLKGLSADTDWSLPGLLYQLERYNGWGYRLYHPEVLSPYLWAASEHYQSGKYVADGTWSDTAASKQIGAVVLLRRMAELGLVEFADQPAPGQDAAPLVSYHSRGKTLSAADEAKATALQTWLNTFPGIFVKVDGDPGDKTSDAYRKVTGRYLPGDPRG